VNKTVKTVWCITFYASDLKKAAQFYEEALGLEKKNKYPSYVGFECGGVEIGLIPKPKEGECAAPFSPSMEFLVDDVEKFYGKLKSRNVKFVKELHEEPWGGKQAAFTDPDGNILEIVQINWGKYFSVSAEGTKKKRE